MEGNNDSLKYRVDLPYPPVKVKSKNLEYARLLHDDYSGFVSELTATTQYTYHQLMSKNIDKKVSETLAGISMVEMEHIELLGETIIKLGGNPIYWGTYNNMNQYWNGSYVQYSKEIKQMILDDIHAEQEAIHQYKKHVYIIKDPYVQDLLKRIIKDEELHIKILTELLNNQLN